MTMDVKFNVKFKFKVNGKEYGSIDEMPAPVREAYEKTVANSKGMERANISAGKIVFNGQEYEGVDSMPADIRQMYETIMKTVKSGDVATVEKSGFNIGFNTTGSQDKGVLTSANITKPIAPKSFFSPLALLILGAIIVLLAGLYIVLNFSSR